MPSGMRPSQRPPYAILINMNRFLYWPIYLIMLLTCAQAATDVVEWKRADLSFEATQAMMSQQGDHLYQSSEEISVLVTEIRKKMLPEEIQKTKLQEEITFVFTKSLDMDAMFFPPGTYRKSSKEEWIITIDPEVLGKPDHEKLIAHEFFHAIHHNFKPTEETWIREGLAQLFEWEYFGHINRSHIRASLTDSHYALEEEFNFAEYHPERYGNSFLYFRYVSDQCRGGKNIIWEMLQTEGTGRSGINEYLKKNSYYPCRNFIESAEAFSLARMSNSYSHTEQLELAYVLPSLYSFKRNDELESLIHQDPKKLLKVLKPFAPVTISVEVANLLKDQHLPNVMFWGIERVQPYRVKRLPPEDLHLPNHNWEIGIILVK